MGSDNYQDNLTAAHIDQAVVIRIEGRGSFRISPPLKQFIQRIIESGKTDRILIDMTQCCSMDSTFMGVLAGLSYHLKNKPGCALKLINLSPRNEKLLVTLGVDTVVNYSLFPSSEEDELLAHPNPNTETLDTASSDSLEAARTAFEAHKNLVNINPANLEKFQSVLDLLQKDVDNLDHQ